MRRQLLALSILVLTAFARPSSAASDSQQGGVTLSPLANFSQVNRALAPCQQVVAGAVLQLTGFRPTSVWARMRSGFVARTEVGVIGLEYRSAYTNSSSFTPYAPPCKGAVAIFDYTYDETSEPLTITFPPHWNFTTLRVTVLGKQATIIVDDGQGREVIEQTGKIPRLIQTESDLILIRYRSNTCDPTNMTVVNYMPMETADAVEEGKDGPTISPESIAAEYCFRTHH